MVRPHPLFELRKQPLTPWQKTQRTAGLVICVMMSLGGFYVAYLNMKSGGALGRAKQGRPPRPPSEARPAAVQIPALAKRADIAEALLQREGLEVGAHVGLQGGEFAQHTLSQWTECQLFYLIDPTMQHTSSHSAGAGGEEQEQEAQRQQAHDLLEPWENKTVFLETPTQEAAAQVPNNSLDYLYLAPSRHDSCSVWADLVTWWPKLRRGGILAGYDYLTAAEGKEVAPAEDWGLCPDGRRDEGATKAAVDTFARKHGLTLTVTYREPDRPSFITRKP